jgi:anti-sigma regulatory factor (Ser/Thr protein kinase)
MSDVLQGFKQRIPKRKSAAPACRRWVEALALPLSLERRDDLVFLANELVTNAVIHSRGAGTISVSIEVYPAVVRVTVTDDGTGNVLDFSDEPALLQTSGRGLMLVRMISSRCGAWRLRGSSVWFEIDR